MKSLGKNKEKMTACLCAQDKWRRRQNIQRILMGLPVSAPARASPHSRFCQRP